jgi:hypothetical protein
MLQNQIKRYREIEDTNEGFPALSSLERKNQNNYFMKFLIYVINICHWCALNAAIARFIFTKRGFH